MSVIEQAGYFTSLPGHYYTSQEIFDMETERVFRTQWLYAGHVSQIPDTGNFFVARLATESLIITRDADDRVRAFFNVCRHRGSQLCPEGSSGKKKRFVCPYHNWSFSLDGKLLGSPGSPDGVDFNYADWPLHEADVDVLYGSIYVHLGREPIQPLREQLGERLVHDDWQLLDPERAKVIREQRYPVNANWKLVLENNLECYHCAGSHPELSVACDYEGFYIERDGTVRDSERKQNPGHFPLREGMKTFSMDGDWVCKKRFGTPQDEGFSASFILFPMY
ncbi:MAG TPA: aromatic ring-hydroxylating dioxygenase subunit alpha, partial [Baekduia sp.]|nr:aromatic ring-hydroxylating dioxygenase subunit alpha [Baekduia sp.]